MKRYIVAVVATAMGLAGCNGSSGPVDLADLGGWDIVVDANASATVQYASQEFASFYSQARGVQLPVTANPKSPDRHIYIGCCKPAASCPQPTMGEEDFYIEVIGRRIVITGGGPRGALYGVYAFLEDYLGVRFLTADHTYVPKAGGPIKVWPLVRTYHPPLEYRYTYYGENNDPVFAARLRQNGPAGLTGKFGGQARMGLINHSFNNQLATQRYGKEHPEYFSLIEGRRRAKVDRDWAGDGTQLCVTNPDVKRIVTAAVLAELTKDPTRRNISVSQNDNRLYCHCDQCEAINQREGSPMGAQLELVNHVAAAVEANFPGVMVGTLSYQYTRKPPATVRPRDNVQIQLCSIECCQYHAIDDPNCPKNVEFCRDMEGWGKICRQVYVWNYDTNFGDYLLPCANLRTIGPNVRYFLAHNAKGIFMQAAGNTCGAEFSDLRNYVISNLLWDPGRDAGKLADEFLDLHYGPSAGAIRRFLNFTHDRTAVCGKHPRCHGTFEQFGLDRAIAEEGLKDFAEAMAAAGTDEILRARVEKASLTALRAAIEPVWEKALPLATLVDAPTLERMRPLVREFFRLAHKYKIKMVNEEVSTDDAFKHARQAFNVADKDEL